MKPERELFPGSRSYGLSYRSSSECLDFSLVSENGSVLNVLKSRQLSHNQHITFTTHKRF